MQVSSKLKPFFDLPVTHNIFEGGRGGGKTRTIGALIVEVMRKAPLNVICGREIQKSLKESSFAILVKEIERNGYSSEFQIRESDSTITSAAGGRAVFTGLQQHTVDSIKSYEGFHWAWIEEAQSISKNSLEVLIPTLRSDGWFKTDIGGKEFRFPLRMFLYTMNPYTWDDSINLVLPDSREDTRRIKINYYDNPWFPASLEKERIEAKRTMSTDEYLRIWEGIPYDNAENAIVSRSSVQAAMQRKVSTDGGIVVGADIARFGADRTVFIKRQGMQVIDMKVLSGKDTQEVARQLKDYAQGGRIVVDDTGVGGGVTDKLKDLGALVQPVNFGWKAKDGKKYPDIISEMWFNLADHIHEIGLIQNNELLEEVSSRHFTYTSDERRKVESKNDYKKRTGKKSPDIADALILAFYQPRAVGTPNANVRAVAGI
jgi:PBSX family phage terminase large subunit